MEPATVTFKGYELNKLNIIKIYVKNTSQKAQRVHILPPKSNLFTIKFNKKGHLAPGLHQEIYVRFTPTEHKYFYDTIRIHTGQQQLCVPIHAYPLMTKLPRDKIFPRFIDFGTLEIGEEETLVKFAPLFRRNSRWSRRCR